MKSVKISVISGKKHTWYSLRTVIKQNILNKPTVILRKKETYSLSVSQNLKEKFNIK